MLNKIAMTKDVSRFLFAVDELLNRPQGTEGMGLLWGEPGTGKTTAVTLAAIQHHGLYMRAGMCWTVTSMLGEFCIALGGRRMLRKQDMVNFIVEKMVEDPRPIFVDEADYLFGQMAMFDVLRDIYDQSGCPVILIGMEEIARQLQNHSRIARRITQWIELTGADFEDTRKVAETYCDIRVADGLLAYLHQQSKGNVGRIVIGLGKIEKLARELDVPEVDLAAWGEQPLFYDQPTFGNRVRPLMKIK